jgi:hypothetical protein
MPEPAEVDMIRCGDELPLTAAHGRWRRSRFRHSRHRWHVVHVGVMSGATARQAPPTGRRAQLSSQVLDSLSGCDVNECG